MKKKIRICSEEWDLKTDKKMAGGLASMHPENINSHIIIGYNNPSKYYRAGVLIHEILESILMLDNKRWEMVTGDNVTQYQFMFDHDYLDTLPSKILDALLSSEAMKLNKEEL